MPLGVCTSASADFQLAELVHLDSESESRCHRQCSHGADSRLDISKAEWTYYVHFETYHVPFGHTMP